MISFHRKYKDELDKIISKFVKDETAETALKRTEGFMEKIIEYYKTEDLIKRKKIIEDMVKEYLDVIVGYILITKFDLSKRNKIDILQKYFKFKYFSNENIQLICIDEKYKQSLLDKLIITIKGIYKKQKYIKINCEEAIDTLIEAYNSVMKPIVKHIEEKIKEKYGIDNIVYNTSAAGEFIYVIYEKIKPVLQEAAFYFLKLN